MSSHARRPRLVTLLGPTLALIAAAGFSAAFGTAANAACSDRPGTPTNVTARITQVVPAIIQVTWTNTASEQVWWDVEMTDGTGRVAEPLPAGIGRGDSVKGMTATNSYQVPNGVTRCFRVKARTERGTGGCVSQVWSNRACVTTASNATTPPPAPTPPPAANNAPGPWSAVAADARGRWGFAVGLATQTAARTAALNGCGIAACQIQRIAQANCIAYAESRTNGYWFGLSVDQTAQRVNDVAMSGCTRGAPPGTCRIVRTECR